MIFADISGTIIMEFGRRNTRSFSFKESEIEELKSLIPKIENPADFQKKYGSIISLMKRKMKEGILNTLVQFYDPLYRCFTFPDYQLMPTLEEYSYILGLSITDCVPFSGLEEEHLTR